MSIGQRAFVKILKDKYMTNKVYYSGNFWTRASREHAGKEQKINCAFDWAGRHWLVPSVYLCGKGLVLDLCMRIEPTELTQFLRKWGLSGDEECDSFTQEQEMQMQAENPMELDLLYELVVNGQASAMAQSSAMSYVPEAIVEDWAREDGMEALLMQYDLDPSYVWQIIRISFPWRSGRRPKSLDRLTLRMQQREVQIPGETFCVHEPGEKREFTDPGSGEVYTLTVESLEEGVIPMDSLKDEQWEFPSHLQTMEYTLEPKARRKIRILDCEAGDKAVKRECVSRRQQEKKEAAAMDVIGGADGPTAIFVAVGCRDKSDLRIAEEKGKKDLQIANSSLYFEPRKEVRWRVVFYEKQWEDREVCLLPAARE